MFKVLFILTICLSFMKIKVLGLDGKIEIPVVSADIHELGGAVEKSSQVGFEFLESYALKLGKYNSRV